MNSKKKAKNLRAAIERGIVIGVGILLEIAVSFAIFIFLGAYSQLVVFGVKIFAFILALWIIKQSKSYSFTLPLIISLLLFPIIGVILFLILGRNASKSKRMQSIIMEEKKSRQYLVQDEKIKNEIKDNPALRYISSFAGYPVYKNNEIVYYDLGQKIFAAMLEELKKAEKFIFIEYFIIEEGKMWNPILDILEKKVKEGVEVRVMYDDAGSMACLDKNYNKILESKGIKCVIFNKLHPVADIIMNHRNHRKVTIIDGKTAFSGGVNLADEYINETHRYGMWKDNGIRFKGSTVWTYTVMFLTLWNSIRHEDEDYLKYKSDSLEEFQTEGFAAPYGVSPLDGENIGEDIYLNMINRAENYVYFVTPYLLIDEDMINSLTRAAKSGVDVRIVIPGQSDSRIVQKTAESYIKTLASGGVKMYTYTPGFVHAKIAVSDDKIATVGTVNMDYRSLYLHFESGVYLENTEAVKEIVYDVKENIIKQSSTVTEEEVNPGFFKEILQALLRLIAPLM